MKYILKHNGNKNGFTLIEILLIVSLVASISAASIPFYARFFTQNAVANTTDMLSGQLRKAQLYAMMGKQNSNWGVHLGANQITLFQGNSYATRTSAFDENSSFNANITINGFTDIIFSRMTGTPSATATITISGNSNTDTITINNQGVVNR